MKKNRLVLVFCLVLVFAIGSTSVLGAVDNVLEPIFDALESFHFAENYDRYHLVIDFILYLIIFIGIAKKTMGEKLGAGAAGALGVILALSLSFFEYNRGYSIMDFGVIAAIIVTLFVAFFIYKMISSTGAGTLSAAAWAFVIMFILLQGTAEGIFNMLEEDYPLLYGIISLMFAIALVKAIMSIFGLFSGSGGGLFKNWGSGGKSSGGGGGSGNSNVNLNPLEKKIDGLQKVVNNMQGKMNEGFEEVSDEVGKVKKIAENIEALCKQIISHLDRFKDFFEKSCNIFEEYEKRFESFFKEITQALQTINTKQGANDMKIQARFDALTQIVSKNQAFLLEVKNSLHSLASNVNQGFKDIGDFFNTITGKINQAEPVMKEYKSKIDDLIKSFNGFNTRLDSIEKDIETINKKEEESKEAHANIITEINNGYKTISERLKNANDDILNLGKLGEKIEEDFIKKLESVKENIKTSIKQNAGQNRNMILGEIDKLFTSIEKIQNNPKVINPKVIIDHIEISTTILQSDKLLYKTMKESAELLEKWKETTKDAKSMIQFHEKLIEEDEDKIKKLSEVEKGLGDIMNKIEARLKEVLEALS